MAAYNNGKCPSLPMLQDDALMDIRHMRKESKEAVASHWASCECDI